LATVLILVVLTSFIPTSVQALSLDDDITIEAGGHMVIMNFTVDAAPSMYTYNDAGSIRYLAYLKTGSEQTSFDVLLMTQDQFGEYLAGRPFQYVSDPSSLNAGSEPASVYHLFLEGGDFTLLIDNSDRGGTPSFPGDLTVHYQVVTQNLEVQQEPRWDLFIGLMAFVGMVGMVFLIVLRISNRNRLQRATESSDRKCAGCGEVMPSYGRYCPYCGKER